MIKKKKPSKKLIKKQKTKSYKIKNAKFSEKIIQ